MTSALVISRNAVPSWRVCALSHLPIYHAGSKARVRAIDSPSRLYNTAITLMRARVNALSTTACTVKGLYSAESRINFRMHAMISQKGTRLCLIQTLLRLDCDILHFRLRFAL